MVLAHHTVWPVERLVDAIRRSDPNGEIVVRHDQFTSGHSDPLQVPEVPGAHVIGVARPAAWGAYELTESILDAWRWARSHLAFDWIVLLTGQDYPVRPLSQLEEHLRATTANAFMELDEVARAPGLTRQRDVGAELYRYRYAYGPSTRHLPFSRMGFLQGTARWQPFVSVRVNPRVHRFMVGYRSPKAPFSADFPPIWARNWVALSRTALDALLDFVDTHPEYVEHYRRTFHSAESFFQSIMWSHPDIHLELKGLHYERWDPRHASPELLDIDDLEAIVASGAFFARKLALGRGNGIVEALDELIDGRDPAEVVAEAHARRIRRTAGPRPAGTDPAGGPDAEAEAEAEAAYRGPALPSLVSVIVPMRNAEATLSEQLDALAAQTYTGAWEVIVADNGSTDRSREIVTDYADRLPGLRLVDASDRLGAAHARNVAAHEARGDVLAFCDSDDVADPRWLEAIAEASAEHAFVGGRLDYGPLNRRHWPIVVDQEDLEVHLGYLPAASSSNIALHTAVFDDLGGFDESYASYGEDTDLSWRAHFAGHPLFYAKDAIIVWRSRDSVEQWLRQVYKVGRVDARLYRDYRARGLERDDPVQVARAAASMVRHAPTILRSREQRLFWAQWLAYRAGRLGGSWRNRVLFI